MASLLLMRRIWTGLVLLLLLSGCEALLFYPQKTLLRTPADVGLDYEEVVIANGLPEGLHGWWLPAGDGALATVAYFHGNAENISTHLASVYWLPAANVNVLLLDYRGFGRSGGVPSVQGSLDDVSATLNYLQGRDDISDLPLIVLGQSLGASLSGVVVATLRDSLPNLAGVILDAGFASYGRIAREAAAGHWLTWAFQYPAAWAMPEGADLESVIADIAPQPLMLIHGKSDEVVGIAHAETLYQAAKAPKTLLTYGGGHTQTFTYQQNRQAVLKFIQDSATRWRRRER